MSREGGGVRAKLKQTKNSSTSKEKKKTKIAKEHMAGSIQRKKRPIGVSTKKDRGLESGQQKRRGKMPDGR